jgi:RNA binding exosome subunit
MTIVSLQARAYVHATESREKVVKAVLEILPENIRGRASLESDVYEGYYGNPIEVLTVDIKDPSEAFETLKYITGRLSEVDRARLLSTLEERVDKQGGMYIRIDKQGAFKGFLRLEEGDDVIRVHVRFSGGRREALKYYRDLLISHGKG